MFPDDAAFWMNHFGAKKTGTRFAEQPHPRAGGICFYLIAIKIKKAHDESAAAVLYVAHELPPGTIYNFTVRDDALDLHGPTCGYITDRIKMRFVFVAQRQMGHQIERIHDAQPGEFLFYRFADRKWCERRHRGVEV